MDAERHYDLIVIGTGAGGGTLVGELASTGRRILVLERGDFLPREVENWSSREVFVSNRYKAKEIFLDRRGKPFKPEIHYYVGGNTKLYGAALLRFRKEDFEELVHKDGVSPAWPVRYDEFEPYYTRAEWRYRIHGLAGVDPTEPPRSAPFPYPPVSHEPRIAELEEDLRALGHQPYPLPMGVMLDESDPFGSPCIRCSTCDGYPCLIRAKADAETRGVRPALAYPTVELLTRTFVERLETDPSGGRVERVVAVRDGERVSFKGDLVVVACGAIQSAALLLRSASDRHPRGLANGSDAVGRFYMCHNNSAFVAVTTEENPTAFQKTLALNDFYFGTKDFPHPMGHIQTMGKADAAKFEAAAPVWLPYSVRDWIGRHSVDFWLTSEDLPDPENRVLWTSDGKIRIHYRENNLAVHTRLNRELIRLLWRVDRKRHPRRFSLCLRKKIPLHGTSHQCGTLRFGDDPKTSVLDRFCKAHELDNLYVVDASFFPSSAAVNPALTVMANAIRVADHLRERFFS